MIAFGAAIDSEEKWERYALKGERDLCVRCRPIREQTTPRWYPLAKSITKQMRSEMSSDADTEKD